MPSKKAAPPVKKPAVMKKPAGKPRAPRKEPPITSLEMSFVAYVLNGTGNPNDTQLERIEAAGKRVGYDKTMASRIYHRKPVQKYMDSYRERIMTELVRDEVRAMRKAGYSREDILSMLYDLASLPPEKTKGSIMGQVAAIAEMSKVMGLIVSPKNPDDFFKGRTEEELANFAAYGTFTKPVTN